MDESTDARCMNVALLGDHTARAKPREWLSSPRIPRRLLKSLVTAHVILSTACVSSHPDSDCSQTGGQAYDPSSPLASHPFRIIVPVPEISESGSFRLHHREEALAVGLKDPSTLITVEPQRITELRWLEHAVAHYSGLVGAIRMGFLCEADGLLVVSRDDVDDLIDSDHLIFETGKEVTEVLDGWPEDNPLAVLLHDSNHGYRLLLYGLLFSERIINGAPPANRGELSLECSRQSPGEVEWRIHSRDGETIAALILPDVPLISAHGRRIARRAFEVATTPNWESPNGREQ